MLAAFDVLIKCSLCNAPFNNALQIPCSHSFCKLCLHERLEFGKLTCPICKCTHSMQSLDKLKPSLLSVFLLSMHQEYFNKLEISTEERLIEQGVCYECTNPNKNTNAKNEEITEESPAPFFVKLQSCFHCKKKLCESCRNRHYTLQRQETFKVIEDLSECSNNLLLTSGDFFIFIHFLLLILYIHCYKQRNSKK
jgi:hypothetical protein